VVSANDGRKGLELYRKSQFDLAITDIIMPEKDGMQVIQEIRASAPRVRIIAISGGGRRVGSTDCLRIALHLGASDTLQKPIDPDQPVENVGRLLKD